MISIFSFVGIILYAEMSSAGTILPPASASRNLFATDLLKTIGLNNLQHNIVYSPASIQSCLALAFFGANGKTADQLRQGLKFGAAIDKNTIAEDYGNFFKHALETKSKNIEAPLLKMANRIYVNDKLNISKVFNEIATKYFQSEAETIEFSNTMEAMKIINSWVEKETENKIKNLINAGSIKSDTSAILVNAIYFKAKWTNPFSESSTHKADFKIDENNIKSIDMMYISDKFKYANLPELDACALEMPYKDSNLSMLIILPNKVDGLKDVETKMSLKDLKEITRLLKMEDVDAFVPKFRVEYDIDLKSTLETLGMSDMFNNSADFSNLFSNGLSKKISNVKHKAYLDVNEAGSEAAAATYLKIVPMCLNLEQKTFRADHPFIFAIRDENAVYFTGHIIDF